MQYACNLWRLSVNPVPNVWVIIWTSVKIKPHRSVSCHPLGVIKINRWNTSASASVAFFPRTKLPHFIPTQHRNTAVELHNSSYCSSSNTSIPQMHRWLRLRLLQCASRDEYTVVQKKMHKVKCIVILQPFAVRFHQNAQKLTGDTKNGQILNVVIKYSLFGSC